MDHETSRLFRGDASPRDSGLGPGNSQSACPLARYGDRRLGARQVKIVGFWGRILVLLFLRNFPKPTPRATDPGTIQFHARSQATAGGPPVLAQHARLARAGPPTVPRSSRGIPPTPGGLDVPELALRKPNGRPPSHRPNCVIIREKAKKKKPFSSKKHLQFSITPTVTVAVAHISHPTPPHQSPYPSVYSAGWRTKNRKTQ